MKHSGFTLVELLIVIVVIGILSTMIMMSSTEAVTSSRAANIVSNLRNIKAAALAYYSDNIDDYIAEPEKAITLDDLKPYLQSSKITNTDDADKNLTNFYVVNDGSSWYVYYDLGENPDERMSKKLHGRANSAELLNGSVDDKTVNVDGKYYEENGQYVFMLIR